MIRFGRYGIIADTNCYTLGIPTMRRDKKGGEEYEVLRSTTYHGTIKQAIEAALHREQLAVVADGGDMGLAEAAEKMNALQKEFLAHVNMVKERLDE